jgi:ABC-type transport system involved in multi-copper enzyme maturation permease subunit
MKFSNPILVKEMRTRMRGKRAFVVLTGYILVLSAIIGLIYLVFTKNAPPSIINTAGRILSAVLIFVQMGLICLIAPTFSSSAISSEREQETFSLLIATLAKPSTILIGKLGAALSYLLLTLFGSLPLIALTYSLGGVDMLDIAKSYLVMIVAGITFCSVSFYWSTLIRRGVLAQLVSLFTVIFLVAAMPALAMFLTALASNFTQGPTPGFINVTFLMLRTNPFAAITYLIIPGVPNPPNSVWFHTVPLWITQVLFYVLLTALSIFLSLRRLEKVRKWL